jgi:hypothetical protein
MRNLSIYGVISNVTVSWNIMSEKLFPHICGLIVGFGNGTSNVDVHHNLFCHHGNRHPTFNAQTGRIVNNISYNHHAAHIQLERDE